MTTLDLTSSRKAGTARPHPRQQLKIPLLGFLHPFMSHAPKDQVPPFNSSQLRNIWIPRIAASNIIERPRNTIAQPAYTAQDSGDIIRDSSPGSPARL